MVIDTNAVLAMWWFADPRVAPLVRAVEERELRWWASHEMRDELQLVLDRLQGRASRASGTEVLGRFDHCAHLVPAVSGAPRLRCSDASDQVFIDLALDRRADWLLSRDRALLKLKRRASALGLRIAAPDDWQPSAPC